MSDSKNSIGTQQREIIKKVSKFIKEELKRDKNISLHDYFYFVSWAENFGKQKLRDFSNFKYNIFEKLFLNIKLLLGKTSLGTERYSIQVNYDPKINYDILIVTYCDISDLKDEKIYDRFFSSYICKSQNTLWLIINLSSTLRTKHEDENTIFINKNEKSFFNILQFYFSLLNNLIFSIFLKNNLSFKDNLTNLVTEKVENVLKEHNIKKLIMPFEAQPLQHAILKKVKDLNEKIETTGYLHSALPPLPTDFIFKGNSPDVLLVHGIDQKKILINELCWPEQIVKLTKSFRYQKSDKKMFLNKIFLPYSFSNWNLIMDKFRKLFQINTLNLSPTLKIENHPYMRNSKKHMALIKFLKKEMEILKNNNHELKKNDLAIFFGATASILEALENGVDAIQICSEPIFEAHSPEIWKSLKVNQLDTNIFKYEIIEKNAIIEFGEKMDILKKFDSYKGV